MSSESTDPNDKEDVKVAPWLTTDKTIKPVTATQVLAEIREAGIVETYRELGYIKYWQQYIHEWAARKGWNQGLEERSFGDWMALLHSEISEAYEDYRNKRQPNEIYYQINNANFTQREIDSGLLNQALVDGAKPCGIPIEMADLAIRLLHFCEYFEIDLNSMIALKMAYNETRPFRHGNKRV